MSQYKQAEVERITWYNFWSYVEHNFYKVL